MMYKRYLFPFVALALGLLFPLRALAQQTPSENLTISPIYLDLTSSPSASLKEEIKITNNSNSQVSLKAVVKKIAPNQNGDATITDPLPSDDFVNWVKFDNPNLVIKPKDLVTVPFTINIPSNAAFGYYFAVAFEPSTGLKPGTNGSVLSGIPAVPILLNVKAPGAKLTGEITSFKTKNSVNENLPVEFLTTFKNTGNVHLKPHGSIFIHSRSQSDLAVLDVNTNLGNVLPGATRTFISDWTDGFLVDEPELDSNNQPIADGSGGVKSHLSVHWDRLTHLRFGPYSASLVLAYNDGTRDQVLQANTTFWVFPYKLIGGVVIIVIVVILLIRAMLRSYVKKQIRRHS